MSGQGKQGAGQSGRKLVRRRMVARQVRHGTQASDTPSTKPLATSEPPPSETSAARPHWLEWWESSRGKGALGLAALLVSLAGFLTTTTITRISTFGPVAFGLLLWLLWRRKQKTLMALVGVALLLSLALVVRVYAAPPTVAFSYNGQPMENDGTPYANMSEVPVTDDPARGYEYTKIFPGEPITITVGCTQDGYVYNGYQTMELEWVKVTAGTYKTLFIPMPFVAWGAIGEARTLLPCSNWRWRLQNLA